ncbi:MAG TPA: DUF5722 domain-containing protein [Candidatus Limnocylindria bacterium]|nr:DUF5722 domain-containing protein [Candidatus Limnocylindria bacterium]
MTRLIFIWLVSTVTILRGVAQGSLYNEPFPTAASKKGLQVQMVDDALVLGVKHAAINLNLAQAIKPVGDTNDPGWDFDGKTYRFQRGYLEAMDRQIKELSDRNVLVYLIVLAYENPDKEINRLLLHPNYATNAPNHLGAFNTVTEDGRAWFAATLEFLAHRWSQPDHRFGRAVGYIIGNEVNSHWWWANMGPVPMTEFADDYLRTVRVAHDAIRRQSSWARVYLSLEHHWTIRFPPGDERQSFAARPFLEYFAKKAKEQGDFDWQLAFHPYPENLFNPRFWNDKSATTNADSPRITFKNIEVLASYMKRPEMLYRGEPRHIIFSEQGFHTPDGPDGELIQAAAYCYAYKKIEKLAGVDAFILHRHVDHPHEGGLWLGLRRYQPVNGEQMPKKKSYECFRLADTPQWKEAFEFALPIVGLKSWNDIP